MIIFYDATGHLLWFVLYPKNSPCATILQIAKQDGISVVYLFYLLRVSVVAPSQLNIPVLPCDHPRNHPHRRSYRPLRNRSYRDRAPLRIVHCRWNHSAWIAIIPSHGHSLPWSVPKTEKTHSLYCRPPSPHPSNYHDKLPSATQRETAPGHMPCPLWNCPHTILTQWWVNPCS